VIIVNFHGGNVHNYSQKLLDFSSNINPLGVPESFRVALQSNIEEFTKYPDIEYIELRKAIGEYLDIGNIDNIIAGNGAIELLYRAIQQSGKSTLIGLQPTFSEYSKAAFLSGIEYRGLNAFIDDYQGIDIDEILLETNKDCAVVICNPNNPTGTLINKEEMLKLTEGLQERNALLIIDEAFMEFTADYPKSSMLDQIEKFDNLIIIKAATKFFGMPGIRLGYAVSSNARLIKNIRESMEPWNVNTAAVIAGRSVLKDSGYIANSRIWISSEREYMFNSLNNIEGMKVYPSTANFHMIKLIKENVNAWQLKERLLEKNILIRTPDGFAGINGQFARLAVKERESNIVFVRELIEALKNK
jgi:threonine-phosphate decarboxylase